MAAQTEAEMAFVACQACLRHQVRRTYGTLFLWPAASSIPTFGSAHHRRAGSRLAGEACRTLS